MNMNQAAYQNDKNALGVSYETAALIGNRLRVARENKRFSPSQVSARVKIRERYIEAIEIGDWDVLPPGLNGRGLIRLYARELSVAIPEFEAFHHLQTVMLEKQSESLMSSSNKKSKYHPAAEESAEVIRSISRSDFQKGIHLEAAETKTSSVYSEDAVASISHANSKVYSRPVFGQRTATSSSIVTPNIYDVLGIQIEESKVTNPNFAQEYVAHEKINTRINLPSAEPVKKTMLEIPPIIENEKHNVEEIIKPQENLVKKYLPFVTAKEVKEESITKQKKFDLNPLQIVVLLSFSMIFVFVGLFLFSRNSNQVKVTNLSAKQLENEIGESEPIPNSIVNSNIPAVSEAQKATNYPPQTKTVASDTKNLASTAVVNTPSVIEVERIAKLNISSKVNITIEADGQKIFSGEHSSGVLDIPFKNKAEINISDASKVSLIYEGVNHGLLGYSGRKRKIVLNAKPYTE